MSTILAATGLAICIALTGTQAPTADACQTALMRATPPCDAWGRCPGVTTSTPDVDGQNIPPGYSCTVISTYAIFDGSKGTTRFCTHAARLLWLPDGRWAWDLGD